MDQMDEKSTYMMSPIRVVFKYEANDESHLASISGDALQALSGGKELTKRDHINVYRAHWKMIHALASTLHNRGEVPAYIRLRDLKG